MSKEQFIKVVKVAPKQKPCVVELENKLRALQEAVSIGAEETGLIEIVNLEDGADLLLNEEGKLIGLEPNRRFYNDVLCGVFYVTGYDNDGNLASLTDAQIKRYLAMYDDVEDIDPDEVEIITKFFNF